MSSLPDKTVCPCCSGKSFLDCCAPYLTGSRLPMSAVSLMRSRYSAYVLEDEPYLLASWHPSTRPADLKIEQEPRPRWLGLVIKRQVEMDENHAIVEFVARYKIHGRGFRLSETSRFERIEGRWFYLDGDLA